MEQRASSHTNPLYRPFVTIHPLLEWCTPMYACERSVQHHSKPPFHLPNTTLDLSLTSLFDLALSPPSLTWLCHLPLCHTARRRLIKSFIHVCGGQEALQDVRSRQEALQDRMHRTPTQHNRVVSCIRYIKHIRFEYQTHKT